MLIAYIIAFLVISVFLRLSLGKYVDLTENGKDSFLVGVSKKACATAISFSAVTLVAYVVSRSGHHGFPGILLWVALYLAAVGAISLTFLLKTSRVSADDKESGQ